MGVANSEGKAGCSTRTLQILPLQLEGASDAVRHMIPGVCKRCRSTDDPNARSRGSAGAIAATKPRGRERPLHHAAPPKLPFACGWHSPCTDCPPLGTDANWLNGHHGRRPVRLLADGGEPGQSDWFCRDKPISLNEAVRSAAFKRPGSRTASLADATFLLGLPSCPFRIMCIVSMPANRNQ
jgi:hypothetical protein